MTFWDGQYHPPPDSSIKIIKLMQADISLYGRPRSLKIISYKNLKKTSKTKVLWHLYFFLHLYFFNFSVIEEDW